MSKVYFKYLALIIICSLCATSLAQTSQDWGYGANTKLFKKLFSQYDSVIAYSEECSNSSEKFKVLVLDKNKWHLIHLEASLQKPFTDKAYYTILSGPTKISDENTKSVRIFNAFLLSNHFWNINSDSLNKDRDAKVWTPITDGCFERITYVAKERFFSLHTSNVDSYQKIYYTVDRERFIECRNLFFELFSK